MRSQDRAIVHRAVKIRCVSKMSLFLLAKCYAYCCRRVKVITLLFIRRRDVRYTKNRDVITRFNLTANDVIGGDNRCVFVDIIGCFWWRQQRDVTVGYVINWWTRNMSVLYFIIICVIIIIIIITSMMMMMMMGALVVTSWTCYGASFIIIMFLSSLFVLKPHIFGDFCLFLTELCARKRFIFFVVTVPLMRLFCSCLNRPLSLSFTTFNLRRSVGRCLLTLFSW